VRVLAYVRVRDKWRERLREERNKALPRRAPEYDVCVRVWRVAASAAAAVARRVGVGGAHVKGEVHARELPIALELVKGIVEDAVLHEAGVVVGHDDGLEAAALGDVVALDEEEDEVLAALAHLRWGWDGTGWDGMR
jgi:hypothetical protein